MMLLMLVRNAAFDIDNLYMYSEKPETLNDDSEKNNEPQEMMVADNHNNIHDHCSLLEPPFENDHTLYQRRNRTAAVRNTIGLRVKG